MAKILIVDDEAVIATQLEERLTLMGYDVAGRAASGKAAVAMAKELVPDLVLMDIVMPGDFDGIDASEVIYRDMSIPVIFLTAYTDDIFLTRAKNVGPFGYIVKPFQESEVKATIEMALSKNLMEKKLKDSKEKYEVLLKNIPGVVFYGYPGGAVEYIDEKIERLTGYGKNEFKTGRVNFSDLVHEKDREYISRALNKAVDGDKTYILEYRLRHKNGSRVWVQERGQIITNGNGAISYVNGILFDITDRKIAEDRVAETLKEKDILLREIHHRVKNNMQVMSSLLSLQAASINDPVLAQAFIENQSRVKAMALIHEVLFESNNLAIIDLDKYMAKLGTVLLEAYGVKKSEIDLVIRIDSISIGIDQAVPCSLAITELITNAIKYAFRDGKPGKITIDATLTANGWLHIKVMDNGMGLPRDLDWRQTRSLGLSLVVGLIEMQLQGRVMMENLDGACFTISFPLSGGVSES